MRNIAGAIVQGRIEGLNEQIFGVNEQIPERGSDLLKGYRRGMYLPGSPPAD